MDGKFAMTKFLVKCRNIEIGDILFASSIAKKLKHEHKDCTVDFDLNYLQPLELLQNNPYIDNVYYKENTETYDKIINITEKPHTLNPYKSAVSQFQQMADIKSSDDTFEIFTNKVSDYALGRSMTELVEIGEWNSSFIKVCYVMDWERKSFLYTEDEYENAENENYGNNSRNTHDILKAMYDSEIMLFAIGIDSKVSKAFPSINSTSKFSFTASLMKNSHYVVGPEGCLTNMSSALGVPTIITTDYIHKTYGPKGITWQNNGRDLNNLETRTPFLGPLSYFPNGNHIHLSPYLTDFEVGDSILKIVKNGR